MPLACSLSRQRMLRQALPLWTCSEAVWPCCQAVQHVESSLLTASGLQCSCWQLAHDSLQRTHTPVGLVQSGLSLRSLPYTPLTAPSLASTLSVTSMSPEPCSHAAWRQLLLLVSAFADRTSVTVQSMTSMILRLPSDVVCRPAAPARRADVVSPICWEEHVPFSVPTWVHPSVKDGDQHATSIKFRVLLQQCLGPYLGLQHVCRCLVRLVL